MDISGRRWTHIAWAVNNMIPEEKAGLETEEEREAYRNMKADADKEAKETGKRPIFGPCEYEW